MSEIEHGDVPTPPVPPEGEPEDEIEGEEHRHGGEPDADTIEALEAAEVAEVERARRAYFDAVLFHFGEDAPMAPCPTCEGRAFVPTLLQQDPSVERCPACMGMGITATGSVVEGNNTRPCPSCRGAGFREKIAAGAPPPPPAEPPPAVQLLPPSAFPSAPVEPIPLAEPVAAV